MALIIKESFVTESPDLTSIIAAYETQRNPIELFFKEEFRSSKYFEDIIDFIDEKLTDLRGWFMSCYPHIHLDKFDFKRCLGKLIEIEDKIVDFNMLYRRKAHLNNNNSRRNEACAQCDTQFNLNNIKDVNNIEMHEHVADILATGNIPCFIKTIENRKTQIQISDEFPIQSISQVRNHFRCLLCQVFFRGKKSARSHVRGKSHTKKLNNTEIYAKCSDFVKHFQQLPNSYHVFQVLFEPVFSDTNTSSNIAFCTICKVNVFIEYIPEHVTCNETHTVKFRTSDYTFLNGYKEMVDVMISVRGKYELPKNNDNDNDDAENTTSTSTTCSSVQIVAPSTSAVAIKKTPKKVEKNKKKHTVIVSYTCDNESALKTQDFIPHRWQNHLKFICEWDTNTTNTTNTKDYFCVLCKFIIKNPVNIVAHFVSDGHRMKSRLELNETQQNYCFYCCLCCKYFKRDVTWLEHLNSLTHKQKESLMPNKQTVQAIFTEYECINCSLVWYGQQHSINAHKKDKFGCGEKRRKPKEIILSSEIATLLKDEGAFTADIQKAWKESTDVLNSIDSAKKCCRAIENALCPTFGDEIKAYPFGSRISGLGNIASDLDVFVDIGSMYEGTINQDAQFQAYCVQKTAQALRKHRDFTDVCPIPLARTPIVQVFHKNTDLDCDLSFRHGLSIENTEFLKFCINVQPKLKSLILFVKKWIRLNKFRDRISTYGISLMAIYMMQNKGHLPSLATLRQIDPQTSKIIAGWETFNFQKPLGDLQILYPPYANSERHLLAEFFDFYVTFDYEKLVICPLLGRTIPKEHFVDATGASLPKEMSSYVNKINANEASEKIKITKSICIQDPFDLSHNVTKALPIDLLVKMIVLMKQSHQLLMK